MTCISRGILRVYRVGGIQANTSRIEKNVAEFYCFEYEQANKIGARFDYRSARGFLCF